MGGRRPIYRAGILRMRMRQEEPSLNERSPPDCSEGFSYGWAATYFPTGCRSIIGTAGLNFSVRNGKRCAPASQPPRVS